MRAAFNTDNEWSRRVTQYKAALIFYGFPLVKPKPLSQTVLLPEVQQPEIEQPEQPEPVVHLESLAEPSIEESVCGSGWSIAELMNEFSWRSSG